MVPVLAFRPTMTTDSTPATDTADRAIGPTLPATQRASSTGVNL